MLRHRHSLDPKVLEIDFASDNPSAQGLSVPPLVIMHNCRGEEDEEQDNAEHDEQKGPETW